MFHLCLVSSNHLFVVAENEWRFGNKDDSKNKGAGSNKAKDAATLVEQEDGEGDDQDRGGEEDGCGVAKGKPESKVVNRKSLKSKTLQKCRPGKRGEDEENTKASSGSNCC